MANYSLAGDCCSGEDPASSSSSSSAPATFPSFWPPFPSFLSDSDSDAPFATAAQQEPAAAFLGLDFHDNEEADVWAAPDEAGLPLCWDCLQLEEHEEAHHQRWDGLDAEEWEQVATGRDEFEAAAVRSLEWEVLLAANSLGSLLVDDDGDTYFLDDAEDALFGQLAADAEHEPPAKGGRAAARSAVDGLPTVADAAAQCAVCKDGIEAGEAARRLPCAHLYHGACILPWLAIRNTCPLCRHELPTDDAEYETWRARRAAAAGDDDRQYSMAQMPLAGHVNRLRLLSLSPLFRTGHEEPPLASPLVCTAARLQSPLHLCC